MARWIRFAQAGEVGFGTLEDDTILVHEGDMFADPVATSRSLELDQVEVLTPTRPGKMIALWNNFHAMAEKARLSIPEDPLYFIKADTSYLATGQVSKTVLSFKPRDCLVASLSANSRNRSGLIAFGTTEILSRDMPASWTNLARTSVTGRT